MNLPVQQSTISRSATPNDSRPKQSQWVHSIDLVLHLVWRDFSLRYKRSFLGILWSLLLPLAQLLVLAFLFQTVVPLNIDAYPAFIFTALLPWTWFNSSISSACYLFAGNRDLVRRPDFTPSLLMTVNTLSNLLTYLVAIPILIGVLIAYNVTFTPALLVFPLLLIIQGWLTVGLSLIVATANVYFRDVQHIVGVLLLLLFYLTPVFYRPQAVVERYHVIYALNPIAVLLQSYRAIFLYGVMPPWTSIGFAAASALAIWALGLIVYNSLVNDIIDLI